METETEAEAEAEAEAETEYGIESVEEDSKRLICKKKSNNNNKINEFPDQGRLLWLKESISVETTFIGEYVTVKREEKPLFQKPLTDQSQVQLILR